MILTDQPLEIAGMLDEKDLHPQTGKYLDSYTSGLLTGATWPDAWENHGKPGGPWIDRTPESSRENELWRKGWQHGNSMKHQASLSWTVEERVSVDKVARDGGDTSEMLRSLDCLLRARVGTGL